MENDRSFYSYLAVITLAVLSQDFDIWPKSPASGLMYFHYTQLSFEN